MIASLWGTITNLFQTKSVTIEKDYPKQLIDLFKKYDYDIDQLPELDPKFVSKVDQAISLKNLTEPVMRFKDQFGNPGIALRLKGREGVEYYSSLFDLKISLEQLPGIFSILKDKNEKWRVKSGELGDIMAQNYKTKNIFEGVRNGEEINLEVLENLLSGKDQFFEIV